MISEIILERYLTDLNKLKEELSLYNNENDLWLIKGDIKNSAGNLALHLIGNLKHFIGAILGNTGFVRNRDKEFADKNVPRGKLLAEIDEVITIVSKVLPALTDDQMTKNFPVEFAGKIRTNVEILFFFYGHFDYHLGQINYHRRLIS